MSDLKRGDVKAMRNDSRDKLETILVRKFLRRLRQVGNGHDLTLEQLRAELASLGCRKTHRQIQRWAVSIPGAKRRGHWRFRVSEGLAFWMYSKWQQRNLPLVSQAFREFAIFGEAMTHELKLKSGLNESELLTRHHHATLQPIAKLPPEKKLQLLQKSDKLQAAGVLNDLSKLGAHSTKIVKAACIALGISRATFYRRRYNELLEELRVGPNEVKKHQRATKLYKTQVLQETEYDEG